MLAHHAGVVGQVVIDELERVFTKKIPLPEDERSRIITLVRGFEVVPRSASKPTIQVRDPDDMWILAAAMDGRAEILVTGDPDLLVLGSVGEMRIRSPRQFWELLQKGAG